MSNQIVVSKNGNHAIANFGPDNEVDELTNRIKSMMPGGQKYTDPEARTLAQIAVAHDLDPFNGEVWLIKDDSTGKVFGALIGIKGHRKHAKLQANYWGFGGDGGFTRVIDPKKIESYGANPQDIVFEYRIMDDVTAKSHLEMAERYFKMGVPMEQIYKIIGQPPVTLGVGIYTKGERTKMKPAQCAMYRAEKDALKRRFDVKFRVQINGQPMQVTTDGDVDDEPDYDEIEAEYESVEEPRDQNEIMEELGFSEPPAKSEPAFVYPPELAVVTNKNGVPYVDLETETLAHMANSIAAACKKNGLSDDQLAQYSMKSDAIKQILAIRNA